MASFNKRFSQRKKKGKKSQKFLPVNRRGEGLPMCICINTIILFRGFPLQTSLFLARNRQKTKKTKTQKTPENRFLHLTTSKKKNPMTTNLPFPLHIDETAFHRYAYRIRFCSWSPIGNQERSPANNSKLEL